MMLLHYNVSLVGDKDKLEDKKPKASEIFINNTNLTFLHKIGVQMS